MTAVEVKNKKEAPVIDLKTKVGSDLWTPPTFNDWLTQVEKERRWLMPGFILEDGLQLLSGQKKRAMKTFFALTQTFCLATGRSTSLFKPVEDMPVLFVEEEGGRAETKERCLGIMKTLGIREDERKLRNIYFAHRVRTKLDDPKWRKSLISLIKRTGIKFVVLDALVYMHSADENRVPDMQPVVETMQEMRYHGATVEFLCHLDKTRGEDRKADIDTQVRGTGVFTDMYDQHIALRRYKASDPHIELTCRFRSAEERKYHVNWLIESHTDGDRDIIDQAKLSILERFDEEVDKEAMAKRCAQKLQPGAYYSEGDLKQIWNVGSKSAQAISRTLCEQGIFEKDDDKFILSASFK